MTNYPLIVANAVATFAKNVAFEVFIGPEADDKPRPVSDVLDVQRTFVPGYPQHIEGERA